MPTSPESVLQKGPDSCFYFTELELKAQIMWVVHLLFHRLLSLFLTVLLKVAMAPFVASFVHNLVGSALLQ